RQLTNVEAAREARVHPNTMSRHYQAALRWLGTFADGPESVPQRRSVDWREWAQTNDQGILDALEHPANVAAAGRPVQISREIDVRVLKLHCAGSTEREIAGALNTAFPRADGH